MSGQKHTEQLPGQHLTRAFQRRKLGLGRTSATTMVTMVTHCR
jgi:hypothetical protein